MGVPSGAGGCEWSIGSAAPALGAATRQGYYRGGQNSHGGSDTLASVMLRSLVCFTFEPITAP